MRKRVKIPLIIQQLDEHGFHIFIKVKWKRRVALALLDTGASHSVFDLSLFEESMPVLEHAQNKAVGINAQEMLSKVAEVKQLSIAEKKITPFYTTFLELSAVNNIYTNFGLKPFQIILGSDFLFTVGAVIDYKRKQLTLSL